MMDPSRIDLSGDRRLWFVSDPIVFTDIDFTGSTFRMQLRQLPDEPGSPLASIVGVSSAIEGIQLTYAGADTVANHIAAGRMTADDATELGYQTTDTVTLSVIIIRFSSTTMSGLPAAATLGSDLNLSHDLLVTLPGNYEQKYYYGTFTVRGTVTQ